MRETQEQTAWRVLVVWVLFNDVRSTSSVLDLLSADVSFNDTPKRMTTELEFARMQLVSYTLDCLHRSPEPYHSSKAILCFSQTSARYRGV